MAEKEKGVAIFNLSKVGRKYDVAGFDAGPDKPRANITLLAGRSTLVPASTAAYLLAKMPNGAPKFPDLIDAAALSPEAEKAKQDLLAENAKLLADNAALKAQLAAGKKDEPKTEGGGK